MGRLHPSIRINRGRCWTHILVFRLSRMFWGFPIGSKRCFGVWIGIHFGVYIGIGRLSRTICFSTVLITTASTRRGRRGGLLRILPITAFTRRGRRRVPYRILRITIRGRSCPALGCNTLIFVPRTKDIVDSFVAAGLRDRLKWTFLFSVFVFFCVSGNFVFVTVGFQLDVRYRWSLSLVSFRYCSHLQSCGSRLGQ